jgi:probable HAF family extracellular repeat protein
MVIRVGLASRRWEVGAVLVLALGSACNEAPPTGPMERPNLAPAAVTSTISATDPSAAAQNTTLDVRVLGSGFSNGSKAELALNLVVGPKVKTNRTTYRSTKELIANITIAADAAPGRYDVIVTTSSGQRVVGTGKFTVVAVVPPAGNVKSLGVAAFGKGVNAAGTVVGYTTAGVLCSGWAVANRPVVWTETGGFRQLPVPAGTCNAGAAGINDDGVIVGSVNNAAYRWLPGPAETWTPQALGLQGSPEGINRHGDIAMLYNDAVTFVWKGSVWTPEDGILHLADLPTATRGCLSRGINSSRNVVGRCHYTENSNLTPVIWLSFTSQPIALPQLPGITRYSPNAINDAGVIVGMALPPTGATRAVRWVPSGSTWVVEDLGTLGGNSEAKSINSLGQIAGVSYVGSTAHAFVWKEGSGIRDLGGLSSQESQAWGINDPLPGAPTVATGWSYLSGKPNMVRWLIE